jgi:phospholipase C
MRVLVLTRAIGYFHDMHKPENLKRIHEMDRFFADAAAGTLPTFSWLQPRMVTTKSGQLPTWQHPDASVLEGERLIKQVYEALRAGPGWGRTLFLVTYDEHGGFYDHVAPPARGVPSPDGIPAPNGFAFDRLGVRVPTLAISPWIEAGTVRTC